MKSLLRPTSGVLAALALSFAAVSTSAHAVTPTTVATGLLAPTKSAVTSEGNLLVAEAGNGPNTGRISLVNTTTGARRTIVSGLPSGIALPNLEPSGPSSVTVHNRTLYIVVGEGDAVIAGAAASTTIPNPTPSSPLLSSVLAVTFSTTVEAITNEIVLTLADHTTLKSGGRIDRNAGTAGAASVELLVDFDNYIAEPRANQADNVRVSNPFDLVVLGDRVFVADASWNAIRAVNLTSRAVSTLTTFAPLPNTRGMGPPVVEAVPDSIRVHDNQLLVTLLTGFAFPIGAAKVISVDPTTGVQTPLITGLTSAIDVLPLRGGGFLTLEFSADMLAAPTAPPSGRLQWFATATAAPVVVADSLTSPTGMEIDERTGSVFITEIFTGRVLKVSPWSIASALTPGQSSQFSNLSVRGRAGLGNDTLIAGFVIESTAKQVLVRGVGPQLTEFEVAGPLADPKISVYDSAGRLVAENDNWSSGSTSETAQIVATSAKAGAFPLTTGSKDAALLRTLPPGAYTVHVTGVGGTSGVAMAEVYKAQ